MKIVLATDGSKHARWAMQWIPRIPLVDSPKVVALHVVDLVSLRAPFMVQPAVAGIEPVLRAEASRLEERAKKVMAETQDFLDASRLAGSVRLERDRPAVAILNHARHGDLVMLGSRGLNSMGRFMLGSVSTQVALHAPCSVLVVKQNARPVRRLIFATDGSKSSKKAVRFLSEEFRPQGIEVELVHVIPSLKHSKLKDASRALVHRDAERLEKVGYTVSEVVKAGHPSEKIIKVAERRKADLIIAGAKGLGAIARFFLGSVSTKLVQHSPCSVLIIR
ncbi:MAG: universal stress protein [Nitrospiraceae bacterium]